MANAGRERLEETIVDRDRLIHRIDRSLGYAHLELRRQHHLQRIDARRSGLAHHHRDMTGSQAVVGGSIHQAVAQLLQLHMIVGPGFNRHAVESHNAVVLADACLRSRRIGKHVNDAGRQPHRHERRNRAEHVDHVQALCRHLDVDLLALTQHGDHLGRRKAAIDGAHALAAVEALESPLVGTQQDVPVLKAQRLRLRAELHALRHLIERNVFLAPTKQNHRINEQGQQEVHQHAANHNQQALPGRMRAELPRLGRLLHLLQVHRLVNHARNLHITAQWQPAQAIFGFRLLGTESQQRLPGVEEQTELLDPNLKQFGKKEMATLMQENQDGKTKYQL